MICRWLRLLSVGAALLLARGAHADANFTQWLPVSGDWHNGANWSGGVPNDTTITVVGQGEATFQNPAVAHFLHIAQGATASVVGTAPLTVHGPAEVGADGGTGDGTSSTSVGSLSLTGSDLNIVATAGPFGLPFPGVLAVGQGNGTGTDTFFHGIGDAEIIDGNVDVDDVVAVGMASGTGTNTTLKGTGVFHLLRGDLTVGGSLAVGSAGGTGSATTIANGTMLVEQGDIIVTVDSMFDISRMTIGTFGGTSSVRGHGEGVLTVVDGRIEVDEISVGVTDGIVDAHGSSSGRLTVERGQVEMLAMSVGMQFGNGGPTSGVVELLSSLLTGEQVTVGEDGKIVFGISGLDKANYGRMSLTGSALVNGDVEARFADGYTPANGDRFTLLAAPSIADGYTLSITGLTAQAQQYMQVIRTSSVLEILFVPEPGGICLTLIAASPLLALRRRA